MLEHGLLDELRLWVDPLIVGAGKPTDLLFGATPASRAGSSSRPTSSSSPRAT
jgi:hypothetical protein